MEFFLTLIQAMKKIGDWVRAMRLLALWEISVVSFLLPWCRALLRGMVRLRWVLTVRKSITDSGISIAALVGVHVVGCCRHRIGARQYWMQHFWHNIMKCCCTGQA